MGQKQLLSVVLKLPREASPEELSDCQFQATIVMAGRAVSGSLLVCVCIHVCSHVPWQWGEGVWEPS